MSALFLPPRVPLVDIRTGTITREWYLLLQSLFGSDTASDAENLIPANGISSDQLMTMLDQISAETQLAPSPSPLFIAADDVLPTIHQLLDRIAMLETRINEMAQGVFIL